MGLIIWIPFIKDTRNKGISPVQFQAYQNSGPTVANSGKLGNCYQCSTGGYISNENINIGTDFTMMSWIKPTSVSTVQCLFGQYTGNPTSGASSSGTGACLCLNNNGGLKGFVGTATDSTNGSLISANTWTHVAVSYKSTTKKISFYVNGACVKITTLTNTYSAVTNKKFGIFTGAFNGSTFYTSNTFTGYMNDVRIYNHCCSLKEIYEVSLGIVVHYKFDDENILRNTIYDCSGYNNNGIIYGNFLSTSTDAVRFSRSTYIPPISDPASTYIRIENSDVFCKSLSLCSVSWWGKYIDKWSMLLTGVSAGGDGKYLAACREENSQYNHFYNGGIGSNTIQYYVDGVLQSSAPTYIADSWHFYTITGPSFTTWEELLMCRYSTLFSYRGWINDLRIYATRLPADYIGILYNTTLAVDDLGGMHTFEYKENNLINNKLESYQIHSGTRLILSKQGQLISTGIEESTDLLNGDRRPGAKNDGTLYSGNFNEN